MKLKMKYGLISVLTLAATIASADTLELKNGSLIRGKFLGGSESEVSFKVGSAAQRYSVAEILSLKFDSASPVSATAAPLQNPLPDDPESNVRVEKKSPHVTIPAGTRISVRTIDTIDSTRDTAGARFQASLAEPLTLDGHLLVEKYALVYGRLTQSKEAGTFTGRSQLGLELTGIVVNGKTVPIVTGKYEVTGESRGASTAKRSVGGAALGAIIGAVADGGKGAAIGAGVGAGAGAGSETISKGDHVKVPSESLLDFELQRDVTLAEDAKVGDRP